jgi:hypothetical protein
VDNETWECCDLLLMTVFASWVGFDLKAVPPSCMLRQRRGPPLAGVMEMQYAARALAKSPLVSGGQKTHHVIQERSKCILCTPEIEVPGSLQTDLDRTI